MRLPEDPGFPAGPPARPTRDLLLAQALDACITAERRLPGSAQEIIARQPAWARADLQRLVGLAGSLDAAASNAFMSSEFRVAARARLMQRIGGDASPRQADPHPASASPPTTPLSVVAAVRGRRRAGRKTFWVRRLGAALVAAAAAVGAALIASASALPGEPFYKLKQAHEELGVRLAPDDQERALALLSEADARLDETARLLKQGRTSDAAETTQRYDQVLERAVSSYVVTVDDVPEPAPATGHIDARLGLEQDQLQAMLQSAPDQARADLREALVATQRGRALVADPRPVERALGRSKPGDGGFAAAIPTMAAEDAPTTAPTAAAQMQTGPPRPLIVLATATPTVVLADGREVGQQRDLNTTLLTVDRGPGSGTVVGPLRGAAGPARDTGDRGQGSNSPGSEEVPVSPPPAAQVAQNAGPGATSLLDGRPDLTPDGELEDRAAPDPQAEADSPRGRDTVTQIAVAHPAPDNSTNEASGRPGASGGKSNGGGDGATVGSSNNTGDAYVARSTGDRRKVGGSNGAGDAYVARSIGDGANVGSSNSGRDGGNAAQSNGSGNAANVAKSTGGGEGGAVARPNSSGQTANVGNSTSSGDGRTVARPSGGGEATNVAKSTSGGDSGTVARPNSSSDAANVVKSPGGGETSSGAAPRTVAATTQASPGRVSSDTTSGSNQRAARDGGAEIRQGPPPPSEASKPQPAQASTPSSHRASQSDTPKGGNGH